TVEAPTALRPLGKIVQSENKPLVIAPGKRRLCAYIAERELSRIRDGLPVVAQAPDGGMRLLCRVRKLESYPQQSAIAFRAVSEFVTEAELEPLGELDGRSVLPVPTGDFNGYGLRTCTEAELGAMYQIPIDGFHCGDLALDESSLSIPFRLPVEL